MTTPVNLEAIKAYMEKATPGNWITCPDDNGRESTEIRCDGSLIANVYGSEDFPCLTDEDSDIEAEECLANAQLIAHAHQDLPACVAEIERLRAELKAVDDRLARRPAIANAENRLVAIEMACKEAGRYDTTQAKLAHRDAQLKRLVNMVRDYNRGACGHVDHCGCILKLYALAAEIEREIVPRD